MLAPWRSTFVRGFDTINRNVRATHAEFPYQDQIRRRGQPENSRFAIGGDMRMLPHRLRVGQAPDVCLRVTLHVRPGVMQQSART